MSVSIRTCPSCTTLLLSDTIQCPACKHILDPERYKDFPEQRFYSEKDVGEGESESEKQCPACGERVRVGLVRCWNCGGFMRDDIAASYEKMRESPASVVYSDLPDDEIEDRSEDASEEDDATEGMTGQATENSVFADDDDFVADQDDFEVAEGVVVTAAAVADLENPAQSTGSSPEPSPTDDAGETEEMPEDTQAKPAGEEKTAEQEIAHSEATGGDALLEVAMQEEAEAEKRRATGGRRGAAKPRYPDGILVYCPNGHRIEVRRRHRGMTGRCPRCKSPFFVPDIPEPADDQGAGEAAHGEKTQTAQAAGDAAGAYPRWLADVHVHTVNRKKLKLKTGSLEKEFVPMDFGFSEENLLAVRLPAGKVGAKSKGLLGRKKETEEEATAAQADPRETVRTHLREGKPLEELPAEKHFLVEAEKLRKIKVAQPIVYAHESMFAGEDVFGTGRIAVWLPGMEEGENPRCASFPLSQFREFSQALEELYGVEALGEESGVPLKNDYAEQKCSFTDEPIRFLKGLQFYQADPSFTLELVGWECEGCGIFMTEDARKKEKIGGPKPQSVPKARCPKCKKKLGDHPLYRLADEDPAGEP